MRTLPHCVPYPKCSVIHSFFITAIVIIIAMVPFIHLAVSFDHDYILVVVHSETSYAEIRFQIVNLFRYVFKTDEQENDLRFLHQGGLASSDFPLVITTVDRRRAESCVEADANARLHGVRQQHRAVQRHFGRSFSLVAVPVLRAVPEPLPLRRRGPSFNQTVRNDSSVRCLFHKAMRNKKRKKERKNQSKPSFCNKHRNKRH